MDMKVEVSKAKAFEIDPNKKYLITIELPPSTLTKADIDGLKKGVAKQFKKLGLKEENVSTLIGYGAKINLSEVKSDE